MCSRTTMQRAPNFPWRGRSPLCYCIMACTTYPKTHHRCLRMRDVLTRDVRDRNRKPAVLGSQTIYATPNCRVHNDEIAPPSNGQGGSHQGRRYATGERLDPAAAPCEKSAKALRLWRKWRVVLHRSSSHGPNTDKEPSRVGTHHNAQAPLTVLPGESPRRRFIGTTRNRAWHSESSN